MIRVSNLRLSLDDERASRGDCIQTSGPLVVVVAAHLGIAESLVRDVEVVRRSIDARKKTDVHFVVNVQAHLATEQDEQAAVASGRALPDKSLPPLAVPVVQPAVGSARPLVVGAGPAGLFCALYLAKAGTRPLLVERGAAVEDRTRIVNEFNAGSSLDPQTNIQFGEGGAGMFSDGKLNTGTKHRYTPYVLSWFADAGAPRDVLWEAKPHIGSDLLPDVVKNLREQIIAYGGEVRFNTRVVDVHIDNGQVVGASLQNEAGERMEVPTNHVVLAIGHSARDTYEMLQQRGIAMERKPFAVGVRIEHTQQAINRGQWRQAASHPALAERAADYKMAVHVNDKRSAYTFCMCPGGTVVAASSEPEGVVTNGMSEYARDGVNANAALLINVDPNDLPGSDPLEGIHLQRTIERAAFRAAVEAGGKPYSAPAQTVESFLATYQERSQDESSEVFSKQGVVEPTYPRGVVPCDLRQVLPDFICNTLAEALPLFDRRLHGFADAHALMTAPESRSSSPVRIVRDSSLQAIPTGLPSSNVHSGIYPCGEGAGYAGGIVSAAADGMRVAAALVEELAVIQSARALIEGKAVVFPTDTVVGLGVAIKYAPDAAEIYRIKQRSEAKPIAWLISGEDDLTTYGKEVPAYALELAHDHWPGALTLIVKASDNVPAAYRTPEGTVALRMPDHTVALRLIERTGCPLATTSANISNASAPQSLAQLDSFIRNQAIVLDIASAASASGVASTIVDCTAPQPRIIRQGDISIPL